MGPEKSATDQPIRRAATAAAVVALFAALGTVPLLSSGTPARAQQATKPRRAQKIPRVATGRPGAVVEPAPLATPPTNIPDPVNLLSRMVQAENTLSYEAREATFGPGKATEEIVKHDPVRGVRRETIRPPGEIFIDDYHRSWLLSTRNKKLTERSSLLVNKQLVNGLERIKRGKLRAQWVGVEQVAGRLADIVSVTPVAGNPTTPEPSRRFWIDQQTGLRLRSEDHGPQDRILSGAYYLTVNLTPTFRPDDFTPPAPPSGFTAATENRQVYRSYEEATRANVVVRHPQYLPMGFRLRAIDVVDITSKGPAERRITQRFDNGLSVLTLTQTSGTIAIPKLLQSQLSPSGAGFIPFPRGQRGYVWHDTGAKQMFLLIGNLPDDDLKKISDSVR